MLEKARCSPPMLGTTPARSPAPLRAVINDSHLEVVGEVARAHRLRRRSTQLRLTRQGVIVVQDTVSSPDFSIATRGARLGRGRLDGSPVRPGTDCGTCMSVRAVNRSWARSS